MPVDNFGHVDALPDGIRDIFMWLCQDMAVLHRKWDFYLGLFGNSENHPIIDGLPMPFNLIEESLRTDMTMAVCRLSDAAKTSRHENLSFRRLEQFDLQDGVLKQFVDTFVANCEPVRVHRDKLIAHSDKVTRLTPQQAMIPEINKSYIYTIIKSAGEIINHVGQRYGEIEFGFGFPGDGGADGLIYWLKKGWNNRMNFDAPD
jgi:hypothetical protein